MCRALLDPDIRFVWRAVGEGNMPVGVVKRMCWEERPRWRQNEEQGDGEEERDGEEESTMFGGEVGYAAFLFAGGECEVCCHFLPSYLVPFLFLIGTYGSSPSTYTRE